MNLKPIENLQDVKGVPFPASVRYRQLLITGPPGSGKTSLVRKIGGWPEEGYIDLTLNNWWRAQSLSFRPREVHLGLPFVGYDEALTVFDEAWLKTSDPPKVDLSRILLPPVKRFFLSPDWRSRFVFEFLMPPPNKILKWRLERSRREVHPVDEHVTLEQVERQIAVYQEVAVFFKRSGILTYVRDDFDGTPKDIIIDESSNGENTDPPDDRYKDKGLVKQLREAILHAFRPAKQVLTTEPQLLVGECCSSFADKPIELCLAEFRLRLYPENTLGTISGPSRGWILVDEDRYYTEVADFARIEPGQSFLLGRDNETCQTLFAFSRPVKRRQLEIENKNGLITIRRLDGEGETLVRCVDDPQESSKPRTERLAILDQLCRLYGGPIALLPPEQALATVRQANEILLKEPHRPRDSEGRAGGIIVLPDSLCPVVIGDLHARLDNLLRVLSDPGFFPALSAGQACLVILGDTIHPEDDEDLEEMDSSLLMLDFILRLKIEFPANVFYLRGNHESFAEYVGKLGVPQGILLRRRARELRGAAYEAALAELFENLPYVAKCPSFVACHGGPPRRPVSLQDLIDIRDHPELMQDIVWNRVKRPNHIAGYGEREVEAFKRALGVRSETPLIVGHTPLTNNETLWLEAGGIQNHHIIHGSRPEKMAVFANIRGRMVPHEYPAEPLLAFANSHCVEDAAVPEPPGAGHKP